MRNVHKILTGNLKTWEISRSRKDGIKVEQINMLWFTYLRMGPDVGSFGNFNEISSYIEGEKFLDCVAN